MAIKDRQKLITGILSEILNEPAQTDIKFEWFINKHLKADFGKFYSKINDIFDFLNGNFQVNQMKRTIKLECDAYFGGEYNFLFEFDEFQHFSSYRAKTFDFYPTGLETNFDIEKWGKYCSEYYHKADKYRENKRTKDFDFIGGRTAQRAYLDCFRDFLPVIHGLNPTLRISEFEVSHIEYADKYVFKRIESILKDRL